MHAFTLHAANIDGIGCGLGSMTESFMIRRKEYKEHAEDLGV